MSLRQNESKPRNSLTKLLVGRKLDRFQFWNKCQPSIFRFWIKLDFCLLPAPFPQVSFPFLSLGVLFLVSAALYLVFPVPAEDTYREVIFFFCECSWFCSLFPSWIWKIMIFFAYQKGKRANNSKQSQYPNKNSGGKKIWKWFIQKYFILCWNESNIYQISTRESDETFVADQTGFNKRFALKQT